MSPFRPFGLLGVALLLIACGGGGQPTTPPSSLAASASPTSAPATSAPATSSPTAQPASAVPSTEATSAPGASLDPSLSDAGVVARVTLTNDTRGGRDGTHDIIGVAGDGSDCSFTFEGDEYIAVAWYDDAPDGMIHRFGVSVPADGIPDADGTVAAIADGAVSFDFVSDTGFGTTYTGAAAREDEGSSTIDVTLAGGLLTFDFEGQTYDGVMFTGQMVCA